MRIRDLAYAMPRYGYRRLTVLLRREGWRVNHKRVYRLYRAAGLSVRIKRRKKLASLSREAPSAPTVPNERWSMDFVSDATVDARKFRVLTVVDVCTRECLTLHLGRSLPSSAVTVALDRVLRTRPAPKFIQVDNGSEFACAHFDAWAYAREIHVDFIRPGRPVENGHIESFNGRLRDECLNLHWFEGLDAARKVLHAWRRDYNQTRPHSRLGDFTPTEFAAGFEGSEPRIGRRTTSVSP